MNLSDFKVRRATVEDLPALSPIWQSMKLDASALEKRLTEFQIAEDNKGKVVGTIGYQMIGKHALIHSEGFTDFGLADGVRPLLWERLKMLAANHGTVRVWTKESARFWSQETLTTPDAATLEKLPETWRALPGNWFTFKLREDLEEVLSLDKEFAMFAEAERERSRSALGQAKVLKTIATVLALLLGLAVLVASVMLALQKAPPSAP
jgi:N-acetylglutamate synthase-like GNAT family acetyltransferase